MSYKGNEIVSLAESRLKSRGAEAKAYCGLPSNANYCDAFVTWLYAECDVAKYFCNGTKQVNCPTTMNICYKELADIPLYLALPGDIILFDWEPNGLANHIGVVKERISDLEIRTIEGNTSGYGTTGVVARKVRPYFNEITGLVQIPAVFRPHLSVDKSEYDADKTLKVDGKFGFNSIAVLQKVLGVNVDAILGQKTVKALQKVAGVTADGSWGVKTSKAVQRMTCATVDGFFGEKSVKALQEWLNEQNSTDRYYSKTVRLGQALHDENHGSKGGEAGDQNGKEVMETKWSYSSEEGVFDHWQYVFRAKDSNVAFKLAKAMLDACENKHIGYDQQKPDRYTLYDEAEKVDWDLSKIKTDCETTCASLVSVCMRSAGVPAEFAPRHCTSSIIKDYIEASGMFDTFTSAAYTQKSADLMVGDILLSPDKHTAMVVKSPNLPSGAWQDRAITWAHKIADDPKAGYRKWNGKDKSTKECLICHPETDPNHKWYIFTFNCIGFAFAVLRHGGGIPVACSDHVFTDEQATAWFKLSKAEILKKWQKATGLKEWEAIKDRSGIPASELKKCDIVLLFDSNGKYTHTEVYAGNGRIVDSGNWSDKKKQIAFRDYKSGTARLAFRYTGK